MFLNTTVYFFNVTLPNLMSRNVIFHYLLRNGCDETIFSQYSRGRGYRDWRTRGDPTLINSLWRSRQPLGIRKQLGNAEVYIVLALLIGFVTVVVGCWLSDNCWSPEPEDILAGG
ncbi:uncharacterized protein LOC133522190 isoform X3 [Cydia pomonella]|uniref:uncharacterized protein LOC133522190 isoform X3 n=1 Tax=Cydia pomonella TaxID=82600 RepID=UPI002ADD4237|nr:uncharacterized protein LOC133522190 isoform X3 [Cydia pomonella]